MELDTDRRLDTAVVIQMPSPVAAFTAAYREACATEVLYPVVPHITVMWPFVSPGTVTAGADPVVVAQLAVRLRAICKTVAPFVVTLDRYGEFPGVLYLAPQEPAPILALHHRILAEFPEYSPYEGQFGELRPHMTLAVFADEPAFKAAPRPVFEPFQFVVNEVCLMVGDLEAKLPWVTAASIALGENT